MRNLPCKSEGNHQLDEKTIVDPARTDVNSSLEMKSLQHTIKTIIHPGNESSYVAECVEISVITQGQTLDEVTRNLQEAVALHLDDEDLASFGLAKNPRLLVTMEVEPA